ncbi:dockerin type I domain-containing protein [Apibacter sp. B2966]|uniref:dockerin type I domain-containing protein n=1 Tax=Apibacter sp. B2966 TaxID=2656761 RepID=UPI00140DE014|nr:dockerin type I domain-containing protein [Apibacter sp. B2966]QII71466.1 hypothetical protein G8C43_01320 [Apibacter sp. B2966]
MNRLLLVLIFYLFSFSLCFSQSLNVKQLPEKEYQALVDIYNQLNGANWKGYDWKKWDITENNLHEIPWSGVTVENGHVTELSLYYFYDVKGKLPSSIKNLEYLKILNLSSYYIQKDFQGTDWSILSGLKNLEVLYLYGNKIEGSLPESWGELKKLKHLEVRYNSINQLHSTIGNMENLIKLELDGNQIQELPPSISKCKLEYLDLSYNNFKKVPKELEEIKSLKTVKFYSNQISSIEGFLPYSITDYNLRKQTITLPLITYKGEDIEISLPQLFLYNRSKNDFSQKPTMILYLRGERVSGNLPISEKGVVTIPNNLISTIKKGDDLYLYQDTYIQNNTYMGDNYLRFSQVNIELPKVPEKEYQALVDIYNQLNGSNWSGSYQWKKWDITENNLHEIPWSGVTVENGHVTGLSLYYFYNVKGKLPESIKNLEYLNYLSLSSYYIEKDFRGTDWSILSGLKNLESLYLYGSKIGGPIPESWGELQKLKYLNIGYSSVYQMNSTIGNMENLIRLELDGNQIQELPPSISKCKLEYLDLSYNNFKKVPKELEEIKSLKTVKFYSNQISSIEGFLPYSINDYNLRKQTITLPLFTYKGEDVEINLPQLFLYNRLKNDFSQKPLLRIYLRGSQIGEYLPVSEKGVVTIPNNLISTIKKGDDLYLYQETYTQNNTYMGDNYLRFSQVNIELPKVPEKEYQALVDIYNQLNGSNWSGSYQWKKWDITENNLHEISWSGVTVENGHVTGLSLYYFYNVKGKLPESIKNLEYLNYLSLSSYYIEKDFRGTDWSILSGLKNLESLYLYGSKIGGPIPESWGELQKLKYLNIGYSSVYQMNSTIGNMENLIRLELDGNQIQELPPSISKCKLEYLDLSYNNFKKVPKELEEIKSLKTVKFYSNQISSIEGFLPYSINDYNLRKQTITLPLFTYKGEDVEINLPQLFLYNRLKNDFSQKPLLRIYLRGSQIGEYLPVSEKGVVTIPNNLISTIKKGDDLYLYQETYTQNNTYMGDNYLRFSQVNIELPKVPEKEYQALVDIYNQLNGSNWSGSNSWKKWDITENNLHEISWSGVTVENGHVTGLSLYYFYNVKGKLPESIINLEYIKILNFNSYYLDAIDISNSNLEVLSKLKNLEYLNLSRCKIQGVLPESWGEMGKLKTLIISKNNISQLFSTIGNMIGLTTLEVDGNQIQDIPKSLIQDHWAISNLNFKNQAIKISELETDTNELIIQLPQICVFSISNGSSNLNGKYIFNIYINNVRKGSTYSNNGMLYFKDIASWGLKYGDKVRIEQTEGYAQGTNIYYDKLTFGRQVESTEFEILKKFHSSTLGFLWKNKWDVSKNNLHLENWYGVGIKDGHIISISLPNNLLMGTIPEEISGLKYLEVLNLNSNEIEGELPISLGNLKKLKILNVLSNKISGNIPASLSESKELKKLILSNNNFSGNIPSIVLNELKEINELDLSNNSFTDIDHPLTFNNADIRNQESSKDEYLELKDDKIIVKLNKINLYDTKNSDFKAKNTFYLQANNLNISKSTAKDSLIIFSDINISEIPDSASIAIWQSDGSASGSHNRYKGIVRQSTTPVFDEEYRALVKLYQKTNGNQWKEKWDISSNNLHIQSWKGIIHNEGHIIEINLSDNNLNGIIPKEIADLPKLKSINLSSNRINGIEKIIPSNVTVILDRQTIDLGKLPLSDQTVIKDTSINRYDHKSQKFIDQSYSITIGDFSKNITIPEKGIKLVDLIQRWNIPTNQELILKQISGTTKYSNISYILTYKDGDSNMDGVVNVLDIQTILNYLQSIYPKYFNYSASDINKDSEINLLDVLLLVNQIQSNTLEKNPQVKNEVTSRNLTNNLSIENNILYLENFDQTVSAFDIRLKGGLNENIISLLNPKDFTLHVSKNHELISILCFSTKDGLKVGKHPIAQIPSGSNIVSGLLSNEKAEEIVFQINSKLLNIEDTNEANDLSNKVTNTPNPFSEKTFIKYYLPDNALDVQLTLYDLQGRVVKVVKNLPVNQGNCEYTLFKSNLTPGVYIYFLEQKFRNYKKTYKRKILVTD